MNQTILEQLSCYIQKIHRITENMKENSISRPLEADLLLSYTKEMQALILSLKEPDETIQEEPVKITDHSIPISEDTSEEEKEPFRIPVMNAIVTKQPLGQRKPVLNEALAEKVLDVATKMQHNRDLWQLIDINLQYTIIANLFDRDPVAYQQAMHQVNEMTDLEEALDWILSNYSAKYNWKDKEAIVNKLQEILEKRFAA